MKYESFLAINGIYLISFFPVSLLAFFKSKVKYKAKFLVKADLIFLFGGLMYWFFYEFTGIFKGKSLSNIIIELSGIGFLCSILFLFRTILGVRKPNKSKEYALASAFIILLIIVLAGMCTSNIPE